jgi:glycosyltransferase involved in cell wall biosynthesis
MEGDGIVDKTKRTVLFLIPHFFPSLGGSQVFTLKLVKELPGYGYQAAIINPVPIGSRLPFRESICDGKGMVYRPPVLLPRFVGKSLAGYASMMFVSVFFCAVGYLLTRGRKVALIQSYSAVCGLVGLMAGRLFGKKVAGMTHTVYFVDQTTLGGFKKLIAFVHKRQELVFASGDYSVREMTNIGVAPSRTVKYTYWVDPCFFETTHDRLDGRMDVGAVAGDFVCLYVGRFVPGKGIFEILDCIRQLHHRGVARGKFVFCGAGSADVTSAILRVKQETRLVLRVERVPNERLPSYYAMADICLAPSTYHAESYNMTLMEAMACGCPVIASRAGGMFETLHMDGHEPSRVGLSLHKPDADQLLAAIMKLASDADLLDEFRRNCRPYAVRYFNRNNASVIAKAYDGLIKTGSFSQ